VSAEAAETDVGQEPVDFGGSPWRQALGILAAMTALRLLLAVVVPLFPDETYYWDWSRHLAGGYFDHPPVIAWLIAGGTALLGDTRLGVRILPILAGTAGGLALILTACHFAGSRGARYASVVFAVIPLAILGLTLATPDAPLLAGIAWSLYAVVRALDEPIGSRGGRRWWLIAGLAIGLAMASKFTAVFIPIGLLVAFAWHAPLRPRFRDPGAWIAVGVASLVMVPVLLWNAGHDWIAFRFQLDHALVPVARGTWYNRELELIGGQAALLTPILFVLVVGAIWRSLRVARGGAATRSPGRWPAAAPSESAPPAGTPADPGSASGASHDSVRLTLAVVAAFCLAFFLYSAIRKGVSANWPAIAWLPGIVLLGAARRGVRTAWERRGAWLALALTVPLYVHVVVPWLPLPPARDQVSKAHGWDALALSVDSARRAIETAEGRPPGSVPIAANRYQDASMLAFHLPGHPEVPALNLGGRPNQYELWPNFTQDPRPGLTVLLVLELPRDSVPGPIRRLRPYFASVTPGPFIPLKRGDVELGQRRLWILTGWTGTWPDPRAPLSPP
jgi:4-amino-4-deoxy-L-arabinose transferase-like glycosyltransferase